MSVFILFESHIYIMSAASTSMGYSVFSDKDLYSCLQQDTSEKNDLKLFKQGILREDAIELSLQTMNSGDWVLSVGQSIWLHVH